MTNIKYNGYENVFSGLAPTPLISKSIEYINYGERWAIADNLTLNGSLTGGCLDYTGALFLADQLKQRFNKSFQPLQIIEEGEVIYNSEFVTIQNISFPENKFVSLVPFSINLRCYPRELFSGFFGVLDPQEEITFSEQKDGIVEINHSISAKGINTSSNLSNAFGNAKSFVSSRTGWQDQITPYFINYQNGINPVLTTIEETPDRFNGTYGVNLTYISDSFTGAQGILRYTLQTNSGINSPTTINIEGEINGGLNKSISQIRSRFNGINFYNLATGFYDKAYSTTDLNSTPVNQEVTENLLNNQIQFSFQYDDNRDTDVYTDIIYRFEEDSITFNVNSTIEGIIKGRGNRKTRWENVQNYFTSNIKDKYYNLILLEYGAQNFEYSLNPNIVNKSETFNPIDATISFSATFDSSPIPPNVLEFFKYNINIRPPINAFAANPLLHRSEYFVQNLNYLRREVLSIQGEAKIKNNIEFDQGLSTIRQQINALIQRFGVNNRLTIDEQSFTQGNSNMERFVSFSVTASYEGKEFSV